MKKIVLAAVLAAAAVLSTGCGVEAVAGSVAADAAQGGAGQGSGAVDAMVKAREQLEAPAYTDKVVPTHQSMLAGQKWAVTGGGWAPGVTVTVSLTGPGGVTVGALAPVVADAKGHIDTAILIPAGTATGRYELTADNPADQTAPDTATVAVIAG